jgi:glycosyltransferase involved in cell wall biosynthesis
VSTPDTLLLITTSYPRSGDGSEAAGSFVADLVAALAEHIHVHVVAPGSLALIEQVSPRITIYRFVAPERTLSNLRIWHPLDAWRILATLKAGAAATRHATADGRVRHTLALWALPSGQWARKLWLTRKIPYSVWMLGSDIWSLGRIPVIRTVLRTVMRDARHRFADGLQLADDSKRICGLEVQFLPTTRSLHTQRRYPPAQKPPYRFVFVGRWHPNKGIDLLLDALAMLEDSDWKQVAEVAIYGGGPMEKIVFQKSQLLIQEKRPVMFGGYLNKDKAEEAMLRADYLIIPSRIESIPVVFSDAMKLQRPVIATPVGDLPGLFRQMNCGVLADDASAKGIYHAMKSALAASPSSFDSAIRFHADRFNLAKIAAEICRELFVDG